MCITPIRQHESTNRLTRIAAASSTAAAAVVQRYRQRPREELYDLGADPDEPRNLAVEPAHAARLAQMRAQLAAWMQAQRDTQAVFNEPRLLAEPASYAPVTNQAAAGEPPARPRGAAVRSDLRPKPGLPAGVDADKTVPQPAKAN